MAAGANQHRYGELVDYRSQIELPVRLGGQNCRFLIFVFKKSLRRLGSCLRRSDFWARGGHGLGTTEILGFASRDFHLR